REGMTMSLVIWPQQPAGWVAAIREEAGDVAVVAPEDEAAALAAAPEAEGWIGRLNPELLEHAPRLRWLQSPSISLESIIFPIPAARRVTLTNMRAIYNDHTATHVLSRRLAHCRDLPHLIRRQIAGEWAANEEIHVLDPAAMTILVMGLGGIGAEVTRRLAPF